MAFRMAALTRTKSGGYKARKAIPADVRDAYQAVHGVRREALFSAPAACSWAQAKARHAAWLEEIENCIDTLRRNQRGEGHDLTQREARALAGECYRWLTSQHEENPGLPRDWEGARWAFEDVVEEAARDPETGEIGELDMKDPEVRKYVEESNPDLTNMAARFLASRGEALTPDAMTMFLTEVIKELRIAMVRLERVAGGDYTPDQHLQTLPEYRKAKPVAVEGSRKTCVELFRAFVAEVKIARSTITRWRVVFTTLDKHLEGRSIDDLSTEDAQRWAQSLMTNRSARTVKSTWVSAAHTVCVWALERKLIRGNPFVGVGKTIRMPRKVQNREYGKELSPTEQRTILSAALAIPNYSKDPFAAACRWAPWLCAYSGARAGEITQLRGQDIEQREGFVAMKITPEAGAVKGSKARVVPIHEHVVEQGFLAYVKEKGRGPLFYNPTTNDNDASGDRDIIKPKRPPYAKTRERLAAWVRRLGVSDSEIQPNHAWRHTFKRRARVAGIEKGVRDTICGHAPKAVGDEYEIPIVEEMADALKKFPRYKID